MSILFVILAASTKIFFEAAFYILLGFVVAAILRAYFSAETVVRYFSRGRFKSVLYASLLGIPIPL
jgi:uncharacterized membrane protein YraQ (UPF0718 family)